MQYGQGCTHSRAVGGRSHRIGGQGSRGTTIFSSSVAFTADLEGAWLLFRWDDKAPNRFHAAEYWGFDKATHRFTNSIYDSSGGMRILDSVGWAGDSLVWSHDFAAGAPFVGERFVIEAQADWTTGDRLTRRRE